MAEEALAMGPASRLSAADQRHWMLRRLHSLSGILPIGAFLFFHIFENSYVTHGGEAWWNESAFTRNLPFQVIVEAIALWIPISYHAVYGKDNQEPAYCWRTEMPCHMRHNCRVGRGALDVCDPAMGNYRHGVYVHAYDLAMIQQFTERSKEECRAAAEGTRL